MHKIDRSISEPQELTYARENHSCWDEFSTQNKKQVRDTLLIMQDFRCAYCERQLHADNHTEEDKWDGHIEHFRRKNVHFHPELTFVWDNLFYSCLTGNTCGKHKDSFVKRKEEYTSLIDPCQDNPEDYFVFDHTGRIAIRSGLSDCDQKRAQFTLDAFNLNEPTLKKKRKETLKEYEWLKNYSLEEQEKYLADFTSQPFVTAIYHYFGKKVRP